MTLGKSSKTKDAEKCKLQKSQNVDGQNQEDTVRQNQGGGLRLGVETWDLSIWLVFKAMGIS